VVHKEPENANINMEKKKGSKKRKMSVPLIGKNVAYICERISNYS